MVIWLGWKKCTAGRVWWPLTKVGCFNFIEEGGQKVAKTYEGAWVKEKIIRLGGMEGGPLIGLFMVGERCIMSFLQVEGRETDRALW